MTENAQSKFAMPPPPPQQKKSLMAGQKNPRSTDLLEIKLANILGNATAVGLAYARAVLAKEAEGFGQRQVEAKLGTCDYFNFSIFILFYFLKYSKVILNSCFLFHFLLCEFYCFFILF